MEFRVNCAFDLQVKCALQVLECMRWSHVENFALSLSENNLAICRLRIAASRTAAVGQMLVVCRA